MKSIKHKIPMISAQTLLACAQTMGNDIYSFSFDASDDANASYIIETEQDDCAIFHYASALLKKEGRNTLHQVTLADVFLYVDFAGIFDRAAVGRNALRQRMAESMFRPEGIQIDFGRGMKRYLAFERSASMSRASRLSFVREDYYDTLHRWMTVGLNIGECQLSKLYAYNGLLFTSGHRYGDNSIFDGKRIVVVENPTALVKNADIITVEDDGSDSGIRKYHRVEGTTDIEVLEYDGEGIVSPALARRLDESYCGSHVHSSLQIRMPYIKGVVHEVDFKGLFREIGIPHIIDLWGVKHPVGEVDMILTKSMFKGFVWMEENGIAFSEYLERCRDYGHALYISGVNKTEPQAYTELNYQFLTTVPMMRFEFRPDFLPPGWEHSPDNIPGQWLTKDTELEYYNLVSNPEYRLWYLTKQLDVWQEDPYTREMYRAQLLRKNPMLINESYFVKQLENKADSILRQYALGRLIISGDNRYLSGDLMGLLHSMAKTVADSDEKYYVSSVRLEIECLRGNMIYAPGAIYSQQERYTLLRNPHIARNEEAFAKSLKKLMPLREKYLGHLSYLVMVDSKSLIPERLGGADFDGDMVKTIADPLLNNIVARNYQVSDMLASLPLLKIPSVSGQKRNAQDWYARFQAVKDTFSSRVGQICNAAFDRSIIAYDENTIDSERRRCREETETLGILTGLEIDSAKTGIKPDLTDYLGKRTVKRSIFLKYKSLAGESERGEWYAPTKKQRLDQFFDSVDWEKVTSNVERLPYLARMLEKHTPKLKPVPAKDHELFTFAQNKDWKERLDPTHLEFTRNLIADYNEALHRIRVSLIEPQFMKRKSDVQRILFARGQETDYSADELYNAFHHYDRFRIAQMRAKLTELRWQMTPPEKREEVLWEIMDFAGYVRDYYDILCDFRHGGYRILGDIICDYDDFYRAAEADKHLFHRKGDRPQMRELLFDWHYPIRGDYKEQLAVNCNRIINKAIGADAVLRCAIALGQRKFALEVLPHTMMEYLLPGGVSHGE